MNRGLELRDQYLTEQGFEACLAPLEGTRRRFREEEARMRERMGLKPSERLPQDEQLRRQFRQWMSDWELRMLQVEWSLRATKDESSGNATSRDSRWPRFQLPSLPISTNRPLPASGHHARSRQLAPS
jgi:hypothetical protein